MADYKDYIVRYDIQADVTKAAEGLQSIANIAKQFEAPMKELRTSITQVSQAAFQLKQNSQITFAPKIDVGAFNNQLRNMVVQVRNAAAEMHAAIFEALSGNPAGTKVAQKGINSVLGGKKSIQDLKNDITAYQKELDKILGTPKKNKKGETIRSRDGLLQMAKNANNNERVMQLESRKSMMQKLIKERTAELRLAEQLEKESAKTAKATEKSANSTAKSLLPPTSSKVQPAKLTNVTPAVIREWKKAFGDAKSKALTVNIRGVATGPNGALTIIEQIQGALTQLQAKSEFTIRPMLNSEAFTAAKIQLQELAALSAKVTAPFIAKDDKKAALKPGKGVATLSKAEKTSLAEAQQRVKLWKENIAKVQARLAANQAKVDPTPGIKGAITRDQNLLAKYQNNLAKDEKIVSGLQNKVPQAVQTGAKGLKPLAIDIVGNLTKINYAGKAAVTVPVVGELTKIQNKVTQSIPVNVKIMADQVQASLNSIAPRPVLYVDIKANTSSLPTQLKGATAPTPVKGGTPVSAPKTIAPLPKLTAAEEQQLKDLTAKYGPLATAQARAEKAMNTAHEKLVASGGTDKRFDNYRKAQQRFNTVNSQVQELNNQMRPLMVKQLQSAVGRELTGDELSQGLKAQGIVNSLSSKQRLTALQKTQLAEANNVINGLKTPTNVSQGGTTPTTAPVVQSKTVVPKTAKSSGQVSVTGKVDTENIISQIKKIPRQTIPLYAKLMWEKGAIGKQDQLKKISKNIPAIKLNLDITGAVAKLEQFITMVKGANPQTIMLSATGTAPATASKGGTKTIIGGGTTQGVVGGKGTTGHMSLSRNYPGYQYWTEQRASELMNMRKDARAAFANLTPYEKQQEQIQKQLAAKKAANSAMRNHNAMLPIAQNQKQLKMLTENRKYFEMAARKTGFNLVPGSMPFQNASYLQAVSEEMRAAGVRVPWGIQDQINKLNPTGQTAKGGGGGGARNGVYRTAAPTSFYDRSRRWAYPFTGNTSFGARTPMAVDMAKGMGVMFAIGGAMSAIGSSFSQAMEYQNTMETTKAILQNGTDNYSSSGFENMARTVRNVGVKTKFSAPEVASAARFLAMAGYDIESINNAIRPIADLALMGDYNLGETADKMTNIMTTFGVTSEKMKQDPNVMRKYGNIMAAVATRSNTDVMMLAESAKYGGGVANMYGREDPNNFADTMALFGVMGNAGIQGSSAGTALRMMYQNIFNPNNKQKGILKMLKDVYGIDTLREDGGKRSMSDIILDMANKIPAKEQADIVARLFRITAQPGAMSTILAASEADGSNAEETYKALQSVDDVINKGGLSALAKLMMAARDAVNGDALGSIAGEKQNTIQGLWAQVTSTFTEGIVKAFEERKNGFQGMLIQLRDYLAKPETITMMKNLLDLIIEIGKVMAQFVGIWAKLYSIAPGVIKFWIIAQMAFTQMGALIAPIVSVIGILDRLGISLGRLSVAGNTATVAMGRTSGRYVATTGTYLAQSASAAPLVVGTGRFGNQTISGAAAMRARKAMINTPNKLNVGDALLAGSMLMPTPTMGHRTSAFTPLSNEGDRRIAAQRHNQSVLNHYAEVKRRANNIYGLGRVKRGFLTTMNAGLTAATFAPLFGGLKSMFLGLMTGLAKAIGLLFNPITLAIGAIGGLGYGIYKMYQMVNGTTDAQIQAREHLQELTNQSLSILNQDIQGYEQIRNSFAPVIEIGRAASNVFDELLDKYNTALEKFKEKYGFVLEEPTNAASDVATKELADSWVDHILNSNTALGFSKEQREAYANGYLTDWESAKLQITPDKLEGYQGYSSGSAGLVNLINQWWYRKQNEKETKQKMLPGLIQEAGITSNATNEEIKKILQKREEFLKQGKTIDEWRKWATAEATQFANVSGARFTAQGITQKEFEEKRDYFPDFDVYRQGQLNKILAEINGENGSIVARKEAEEQLRAKILKFGDDKYREAIGNVLAFSKFPMQIWDKSQKAYREFEFIINTMPDGHIDMTNLVKQVTDKVAGAKLTLHKFTDSLAQIYKALAELGLVALEDIPKLMQEDVAHAHLEKENAIAYFQKYIAGRDNEWTRAGYSPEKYADAILAGQGKSAKILNVDGRKVNTAQERALIRKTTALSSFNQNIKPYTDQISQAANSSNGNSDNGSNTSPTTTVTPPSQNDYASNYGRDAAKPTHVSINIQNLANFDRTTIAANADERDLMANLEGKIAEAVYRIFAEASNQAQLAFNA